MDAIVRQRGRAASEFLSSMNDFVNGELRDRARTRFEEVAAEQGVRADREEFEDRIAAVNEVGERVKEWRFDRVYSRIAAEGMWTNMVLAAVESSGAGRREERLDDLIAVNPNVEVPEWYSTVNYHVSPWFTDFDEYVYEMPSMALTGSYKRKAGIAAVPYGSDLLGQRADVVASATTRSPSRILDIGSGGNGAFVGKIQDRYPDAEIHAVDVSARLLNGVAAMAKSRGDSWVISQENGECLEYPDDHFDMVTSYALLHEVPQDVTANVFREALRVLEPGGEMLMSDVPPYREIPDFQFLLFDWETDGRVEPYWRESCLLDRKALAESVGFVDVEEYALGAQNYPWVIKAFKPTQA